MLRGWRLAEWRVWGVLVTLSEEATRTLPARLRGLPPPSGNVSDERYWRQQAPVGQQAPVASKLAEGPVRLEAPPKTELERLKAEVARVKALAKAEQEARKQACGAPLLWGHFGSRASHRIAAELWYQGVASDSSGWHHMQDKIKEDAKRKLEKEALKVGSMQEKEALKAASLQEKEALKVASMREKLAKGAAMEEEKKVKAQMMLNVICLPSVLFDVCLR